LWINNREEIRLGDPDKAWYMGQNRDKKIVKGFFDKKVEVMYLANYIRIKQSPKLQHLLLSIEGNITFPGSDEFWGTFFGEGGENWNGINLMKIREEVSIRSKIEN